MMWETEKITKMATKPNADLWDQGISVRKGPKGMFCVVLEGAGAGAARGRRKRESAWLMRADCDRIRANANGGSEGRGNSGL
jgi:hypothetical protein